MYHMLLWTPNQHDQRGYNKTNISLEILYQTKPQIRVMDLRIKPANVSSGVLGDGVATRDLSPNPYTSARQIRWFGGYSHQVFPFSHQKMLYFGLDVRGHGYLATTNLSSAAIHPIFKPISGQTSIWNSKPAIKKI